MIKNKKFDNWWLLKKTFLEEGANKLLYKWNKYVKIAKNKKEVIFQNKSRNFYPESPINTNIF